MLGKSIEKIYKELAMYIKYIKFLKIKSLRNRDSGKLKAFYLYIQIKIDLSLNFLQFKIHSASFLAIKIRCLESNLSISNSFGSPTNKMRHVHLLSHVPRYAPIIFPAAQPAEFRTLALFPCALPGRAGSTILRRMIIKRGRVAWTFGKRPRFVQQSALTADRNTWTRPASRRTKGKWEGEVRVEGWGWLGRRGLQKGLVILTEAFAPAGTTKSDFAKCLTKH